MIRTIRAGIRRLKSDESGLSFVELLVASILSLLVLAMVGNMFISVAKITSNSTQVNRSNTVASNMANSITSVLRVATTIPKSGSITPMPAIVKGSGTENLTIYSLSNVTDPTNPVPVRVTYTIETKTDSAGQPIRHLLEERCVATLSGGFYAWPATCAAANYTKRYLGEGLQSQSGTLPYLFTYYQGTTPITLTSTTSDTDLAKISSIRVYVSIKANGSAATLKPAVISNTVVMGNLGLDKTES